MYNTNERYEIKGDIYESSRGDLSICITHHPVTGEKLKPKKYVPLYELERGGMPFIGSIDVQRKIVFPQKKKIGELKAKINKLEQDAGSLKRIERTIKVANKVVKGAKQAEA